MVHQARNSDVWTLLVVTDGRKRHRCQAVDALLVLEEGESSMFGAHEQHNKEDVDGMIRDVSAEAAAEERSTASWAHGAE